MKQVLVTGGYGQLATAIKDQIADMEGHSFTFVDYDKLDITKEAEVAAFFGSNNIDFCVNCAAYTAVDKAESEVEMAKSINVDGARILAAECKKQGAKLIHISTDFVFGGDQTALYSEGDPAKPLGVYGQTKLDGERGISATMEQYFIIRTSWLYSEHGNNFMKTMLRLGREREELSVVCDQIGTPTYAGDLARLILEIVANDTNEYGLYHYSNEGVASWYDFAKAIFELGDIACALFPILTVDYPTPAARPAFSVMDKSKVKAAMRLEIPYWRDSLKECLKKVAIEN
tara:strand:- start:12158 stop:13021 length:864 start_codon:yes stop_codon:yes gene_type:complete